MKNNSAAEYLSAGLLNSGIPFRLVRSSRRTLELRVSIDGVTVRAPQGAADHTVFDFIKRKDLWISRAFSRLQEREHCLRTRRFCDEAVFFVHGAPRSLRVRRLSGEKVSGPSLASDDQGWLASVPGDTPESEIRRMLTGWFRRYALDILPDRVRELARMTGIPSPLVVIKDHKRLWGSCQYGSRTVNLNWRLVMFPLDVMDYVIIHELCHLRHPDHSGSFWKAVAEHCPEYRQKRLWLKEQAHHYLFS
jgi:predicted metal-dependent hydrolase